MKGWKRVVDNRMNGHGDIDLTKRVIRINKSKKKNKKSGEILDSIVHEEYHKNHPKATEKTTYKKVKKIIKKLGVKAKKRLYSKYKK